MGLGVGVQCLWSAVRQCTEASGAAAAQAGLRQIGQGEAIFGRQGAGGPLAAHQTVVIAQWRCRRQVRTQPLDDIAGFAGGCHRAQPQVFDQLAHVIAGSGINRTAQGLAEPDQRLALCLQGGVLFDITGEIDPAAHWAQTLQPALGYPKRLAGPVKAFAFEQRRHTRLRHQALQTLARGLAGFAQG